ncbi:MAG: hypothetical protein ACXVBU_15520 [Ktedonobacteraceae bacterium]
MPTQRLAQSSSAPAKKRSFWQERRAFVLVGFLSVTLFSGVVGGKLLAFRSVNIGQFVVSSRSGSADVHQLHAAEGLVWFYDLQGQGDGVVLRLSYLPTPPKGQVYVGWLIDALRPDHLLAIGPLWPDKSGNVLFSSEQIPGFNAKNLDLRLLFTQGIVTAENAASRFKRPTGPTLLQGHIDRAAVNGLSQLFVTAPSTPGQIALMSGLRSQMHELERWITNLQDSKQANGVTSMQVDLLRLIYVVEGANGPDVARLDIDALPNITHEGDGFGFLSSNLPCSVNQHTCGYLDAIRVTLQTLATQGAISKATMHDLLTTLTTIDQLIHIIQRQLLALVGFTTSDTPTLSAIGTLSTLIDTLLNGSDRNGDGRIDPISGEAAVAQLYAYVQLVGAIRLG